MSARPNGRTRESGCQRRRRKAILRRQWVPELRRKALGLA